jgi:cytochrome P450 family 135
MRVPLPPGPDESPLRQTVAWVRRPIAWLDECSGSYGETFTLRLASMPPMVMLSNPEAVREVFTGDPEVLRSGEANALLATMLGHRSLLVLDGAEHLRERRLMLPPFHGERMRRYRELISAVAERQIATWPVDAPFRTAPSFRHIALEVIVRAVFGVEEPERMTRLMRALRRMLDATGNPARVLFLLLLLKPDGPTVRLAALRADDPAGRRDSLRGAPPPSRRSRRGQA